MGKVKQEDPAKLTNFKALTFDVYSTLIDEKGGMFTGLQPLLSQLPVPNPYINDRFYTLSQFQKHEQNYQETHPTLLYRKILPLAYTAFAASLNLPEPPQSEAEAFGMSVGSWPAFPDTVAALQSLKKHYKLVILSNIDNESIARTLSGPLKGADFDAVYTAENIGSYKPDLKNFEYLLRHVKELGVAKEQVLHTAQSLTHDHVPAKTMGITSAWIDRDGETEKYREWQDKVDFTWRFETMGEMATAVEEAMEGL